MAFDEAGLAELLLEGRDGGIEALEVADLQHPLVLAGQGDQRLGLLQRGGHRFLDEDVGFVAKEILRHFKMKVSRHHDTDGIHLAEQFTIIRNGGTGGGRCHRLRLLEILVNNSRQATVFQLKKFLCVKLAQMPYTDDGRLYL